MIDRREVIPVTVGAVLLVLLVLAVLVGVAVGGRGRSDRLDRSVAWTALALAVLACVVATYLVLDEWGPQELPVLVVLEVVPLVLTVVPLVLRRPTAWTRLGTALCALLLVAYVATTGLSIGLFFAPAALALVVLATMRARRPVQVA